jgi:poly(hydroxyalkanoate) granule-associated protein
MAARKKTGRLQAAARKRRTTARRAPAAVLEGVQQVWLAGMGAIARAQKEGPAAFQDAVADGLKLLDKSRAQVERMIRDVFETAQGSVQSRLDTARDQATETWDNLEALFQSRVQKALQQIGVPSADEIRLLTRRVAELNESVLALSGKPGRSGARQSPATRSLRKTARRVSRRGASRTTR